MNSREINFYKIESKCWKLKLVGQRQKISPFESKIDYSINCRLPCITFYKIIVQSNNSENEAVSFFYHIQFIKNGLYINTCRLSATYQQRVGEHFFLKKFPQKSVFFRSLPAGLKIWTGIYGLASILGGTRKKLKKQGNYFPLDSDSNGSTQQRQWTRNSDPKKGYYPKKQQKNR